MDADDASRIAPLAAVPADSSLLFRVRDPEGSVREAILLLTGAAGTGGTGGGHDGRTDEDDHDERVDDHGEGVDGTGDGAVAAWLNSCRHFTHVRLDKGDGAQMRDGEVVCTNHGAMFEIDTGRCTHGPCEGATLVELRVAVVDGAVYLTDPDHAFVGRGPIERDPADLSATANVEF